MGRWRKYASRKAVEHRSQWPAVNKNPADLRAAYPSFYWKMINPYIGTSLRHLQVTQEGKQWMANLYANVFAEEHGVPALGPVRRD